MEMDLGENGFKITTVTDTPKPPEGGLNSQEHSGHPQTL